MNHPPGIEERVMIEGDKEFFVGLIKECIKPLIGDRFDIDHVRAGFVRGLKVTYILMKGKRRIGFYELKRDGNTLEISRLFFTKTYRGKGLGTWYMQEFERLGYNHMYLEVWENNPALRLYKRMGYRQIRTVKNKIQMEKRL